MKTGNLSITDQLQAAVNSLVLLSVGGFLPDELTAAVRKIVNALEILAAELEDEDFYA